jgi:HNH endonuclease
MKLRSPEDGSASRIDMTENGILLSKNVHSMLGRGLVALIKV